MTQLYVSEHGAKISRKGERLVVTKQGKVLEELPLTHVEQVVLNGKSQITSQAMQSVLKRGGNVTHLFGNEVAVTSGGFGRFAELQIAQMRHFDDKAFCLRLAKRLIVGKVNNQRTLLQRQAKRMTTNGLRVNQTLFQSGLSGMMAMLKSLDAATDLDSLRGYEGKAAAYYFEAIRSLLNPAWGFTKRQYYPAPDPINALLSFSYTLVMKEVLAAAMQVGLNPYMGFFHAVKSGRQALAIDMMEEWRPVVADAMVLELLNRGVIRPNSFNRTNNPRRPVLLNDDSRKRVIAAFEGRLASRHHHSMAGPGGTTTLRQAMLLQMRQIAQLVNGKREAFEPFQTR